MKHRVCKICEVSMPISKFPHQTRKSGRVMVLGACKPCHREAERKRRAKYRAENLEHCRKVERDRARQRYAEDESYREHRKTMSALARYRK